MKNLTLFDYVFHFNPYTGIWTAFLREDYNIYFNAKTPQEQRKFDKRSFKSKSIKTLEDAILHPSLVKQ